MAVHLFGLRCLYNWSKYISFADVAPTVISVRPLVPNESQRREMQEENYGVKPNETVWHDKVKGEHDR